MNAFVMLPLAAAAILAVNICVASSQGACQPEFQACMDGCTTRSSKTLQDSCFVSCEGRNNLCAEGIYGKRPFNGTPSTAAAQKLQAKDALARTEKDQPLPSAEAEQTAAPGQRGPARR